MRDPHRISPVLELLEHLWRRDPDLRLGQLVTIGAVKGGWKSGSDIFHVEDDVVISGLLEYLGNSYRDVVGSDVPNDGMYVELRDSHDDVAACVFRSDATGEFEIHMGPAVAPSLVTEAFVKRAKANLAQRSGA